jgi:hypothetical protein
MARCTVRLRSFSSTLGSISNSARRDESATTSDQGFGFGHVNGARDGGAYVSENVFGTDAVIEVTRDRDREAVRTVNGASPPTAVAP